eukprot:g7065.t1
MKLFSACCGAILLSMHIILVDAARKMYYDYRPDGDFETEGKNCENALENKTRYLQIEVFDYNSHPWIIAKWTQVSDECGNALDGEGFTADMEYDFNKDGEVEEYRLQMDMYVCAPWGNYELEIQIKSANYDADGNPEPMQKVAWEVEYGGDEVCQAFVVLRDVYRIFLVDTLNTPFFGYAGNFEQFTANGHLLNEHPYAPIPRSLDETGSQGTTYKWPLQDSKAYYSLMYSGPFPPLDCPNLHSDIDYVGCYRAEALAWEYAYPDDEWPNDGNTETNNGKDPAEPYRMFDGIEDDGLDAKGVMTLQKCANKCSEGDTEYTYIGLQSGYKCLCGNELEGDSEENCGLVDDNVIPEYKYLCSGDSRVLCGTDTKVSVYAIGGSYATPSPTPAPRTTPSPTPAPRTTPSPTTPSPTTAPPASRGYKWRGCSEDYVPKYHRVMPVGPRMLPDISEETCYDYCKNANDDGDKHMYFGLENGNECFCAEDIPDDLDLEHPDCTKACKHNPEQICGGWQALSVFEIEGNSDPYEHVGCHTDSWNERIMGDFKAQDSQMTIESCSETCWALGSTHFGLQYSTECFCGDDSKLGMHDVDDKGTECDYECGGNRDEICGGYFAMTTYVFTEERQFRHLGCYADKKGDRVMVRQEEPLSPMSPQPSPPDPLPRDSTGQQQEEETMRASSAISLIAACCGGLLMGMPVESAKKIYDYRPPGDKGTSKSNCANAHGNKTRYIQVEVFDYNLSPKIKATYRQIADECGGNKFTAYEATMVYDGPDVTDPRLQMDMYICAPFGEYELEVEVKSTNGLDSDGNLKKRARVAWEIEYGADEYHIWDTLNTPFFGDEGAKFAANGATLDDYPYAPIPTEDTTYVWPLFGSEGYYSTLYTGPFPPNQCSNLYPSGVEYVGCFPSQSSGWTTPTTPQGPTGSKNGKDPAENYRMYDGLGDGDKGVDEEGVMTLEKCAGICSKYSYMGLQSAVQVGKEKKQSCSGDPRVLCGTDQMVSIYSLDGTGPRPNPTPPTPTPPTPTSPSNYELLGCSEDNVPRGNRVMSLGPIELGDSMSAEMCMNHCLGLNKRYAFFGTEYGKECFCSTSLAGDLDLEDLDCTQPCKNNGGEICGGNDAISVYKIGDGTGPTPTPPTPTPPTPTPTPTPSSDYQLQGCSEDNVPRGNRVMSVGPISRDEMSAEICFKLCMERDAGYTYFGTQYAIECFCSTAVPQDLDLSDLDCTEPCAKNSDEICGGFNAISVYMIGDGAGPTPTPPTPTPPTPTPTPTPTPPTPSPRTPTPSAKYQLEGCSEDNVPRGKRVMSVGPISRDEMSAEICFKLCMERDAGYTYFGTQYAIECFCSTAVPQDLDLSDLDCTEPCAKNTDEICGGFDAISVYMIGDGAGPTPTPSTPAPHTPTTEAYTLKDCYVDNRDSRVMEAKMDTGSDTKMSEEICYGMCTNKNAGYTYFGLQYSHECWCSTTFSEAATTEGAVCNYKCSKNTQEFCGGFDAIMVYEINS